MADEECCPSGVEVGTKVIWCERPPRHHGAHAAIVDGKKVVWVDGGCARRPN